MPSYRVKPEVAQNEEKEISHLNRLINEANTIKRGDSESFKILRQMVRGLANQAGLDKDRHLGMNHEKVQVSSQDASALARMYLGEEKAYKFILAYMEEPDQLVSNWEERRNFLLKRLQLARNNKNLRTQS